MKERFSSAKQRIGSFLDDYFDEQEQVFSHVGRWPEDVFSRLREFSSRGKMLRGSLVVVLAQAFGRSSADAVRVGAALELLQSGVLVHDDIMDADDRRRGGPALHAQFARLGGERFGLGAGVCAGDVSFFLAFGLLNGCSSARSLIEVFSRETAALGFGQVEDVWLGESDEEPSAQKILSVYRYKTGRYTFSLPLLLCLSLVGREELSEVFGAFGEELGVVYQVRDDELGLFGSEQETGKPVGADVREDKRTLLRLELLRLSSGEDKRWLSSVFGSDVSADDLERVRSLAEELGVRAAVRAHASVCERRAASLLDDAAVPVEVREVLDWLVSFTRARSK